MVLFLLMHPILYSFFLFGGAICFYKEQDKYSTCKDVFDWRDCNFYKSIGYCEQRAENLRDVCARTCNFCDFKKVKENRCTDKDGPIDCAYLKNQGACSNHEALMIERCARTCSLCEEQKKCDALKCSKDKICVIDKSIKKAKCECPTHCLFKDEYKKLGKVCGTNGVTYEDYCDLLHSNCKEDDNVTVAFYGICPVDEPCEDSKQEKNSGFCDSWKKLGLCENESYKSSMKAYCPRTCNLCPEKRLPIPQISCQSSGSASASDCCLDSTSNPSVKKECGVCKDRSPDFCAKFIKDCNSSFKNAQMFMKINCPALCGFCLTGPKKVGIKIFSQSGKKLAKTYYKFSNT